MKKSESTTDALEIIRNRYFKDDPNYIEDLNIELAKLDVAQKIYDLRTKAGLTQKDLAKMIGTTPSVISRLEDADYQGHSLAMLRRIAEAMGKRVEIRFVTIKTDKKTKSKDKK
jgi:ribosome-binding protein aMBF1 (putative translation factor)